ncbi:MAG: hypothetical protein MZU95_13875, partial [Desulfomicrobium escambiense]|nr:hypothetical protein [Desulfomicrobium escambiense]
YVLLRLTQRHRQLSSAPAGRRRPRGRLRPYRTGRPGHRDGRAQPDGRGDPGHRHPLPAPSAIVPRRAAGAAAIPAVDAFRRRWGCAQLGIAASLLSLGRWTSASWSTARWS